jgi:hypothetical protein
MEFYKDPGFILRLVIVAGYIALAVYLFIHPGILSFLSKEMTYAFAAVILLYALFRGYRAYQLFKEEER